MARPSVRSGVVEDCLALDIVDIRPRGHDPCSFHQRRILWISQAISEEMAVATIVIGAQGKSTPYALVRVASKYFYQIQEQKLPLVSTRPHFSGQRWWFLCPLGTEGSMCGNRCGKLYLPPSGGGFGCRECHNLTYTSCRESHMYDRLFAKLAKSLPDASQLGMLLQRGRL